MAKNKPGINTNTLPESFTLPFDNNEQKNYILKNKTKLTEKVISSIESAINNNYSAIEVFQFKNSDFVIIISKKDFKSNLDLIYQYYLQSEKYELLPRVVKLQKLLTDKELNINEK